MSEVRRDLATVLIMLSVVVATLATGYTVALHRDVPDRLPPMAEVAP